MHSFATLKQRNQKIFSGQLILDLKSHQTTERVKTTYPVFQRGDGIKKTAFCTIEFIQQIARKKTLGLVHQTRKADTLTCNVLTMP